MFQMGVFKLACSYFLCYFWYFAYAIYFRLKRLETDEWKNIHLQYASACGYIFV